MSQPPDTFDYVIVGAGSAGSLLADRLSQDGRTTVCVIEAGPPDRHPYIHIPAGFIKMLFNPVYTWSFKMEPSSGTAGRSLTAIQGKTLGGTSSINGMIHNRGQRSDYDAWERQGNRGWSYDALLPYFKRTERRLGLSDDRFRGRAGKLPVTDNDWCHPICEAFIAGAIGVGIPRNADYNGISQFGVSYTQRTIYRGRRWSATRAFLRPAMSRRNLAVRTGARAIAILMSGKKATGVRYVDDKNPAIEYVASAGREVIVAGGAINSPRLLQLSGIGSARHLSGVGLPVVHDLPGVGEKLVDHYAVRLVARAKGIRTMNELARGAYLGMEIGRWLLGRPSILGLSTSIVMLQGKSTRGMFSPGSYKEGFIGKLDEQPGMTCGFLQHRPESVGFVHVRSADPFEAPLVDPNYLASLTDQQELIGGLRLGRQILHSPELARYLDLEQLPGSQVQRDDEWLDFCRRYGNPANHYVGTCRMGPSTDATAVVDTQLRVHGLDGLRVVDASVMPTMPSANTCCPTYMIAEKAADMITGVPPLPPAKGIPAEDYYFEQVF